ncbi:MAG: methyl-accepting chemotaxis protein [Bdellovibrionales bacterium]|nr:methyl-accepting chemotaxis protein [Bdellovibrionales bacterium]
MKYTNIAAFSTAIGLLFVFIPLFYYMNQNYNLFIELAYLNSPNIVTNLESEKFGMNTLLVATFLGQILFIFLLMLKLTAKIAGPLKVLKNHLKLLSRGHWHAPVLKVREDDEFQDVIDTYNYFFLSFKENLKQDLESINQLKIDKKNSQSHKVWKELIDTKEEQLGIVPVKTLTVLSDVEGHDSRHVS